MNQTYKEKVKKYISGTDSQIIIYNSIILIGILALSGVLATEYVMGYGEGGFLMMAVLWVYLVTMAVLANIYPKKVQLFSVLVVAPVNFLMFPYMFLFTDGGGIKSGMPVWLTFGIILVCIITKGMYFKITIALTVMVDVVVLIYGYIRQESVGYVGSEYYYYQDNLIAILAVSCCIGIILKYQEYMGDKQAERIKGVMLEADQEKNNAQKADTAKTNFLASMSHDIRTPMNAIVGLTDIAAYSIGDKEKVSECLEKIKASSMQLLNLLNNILDVSEIEASGLKLRESQFGMDELVENIQSVFAHMALSRKVDFKVNYEAKHSNLIGDSVRLRQVLMNLVSNSIKYTQAFGRVRVTARETGGGSEEYASFDFEVVDTGVGMTKDFIENQLFKPFERSDNRYVQKIEGSGIGMSITKEILDAMGASIQVESEVGKGTRILVHFTFRRDNESKNCFMKEEDGVLVLDASGKNLLVVEDNEINMEIIKVILERTHAHIVCAWDAEEAIDLFSESRDGYFDLILMDIQLPGMDGYGATRTIRCMERRDSAKIPIMAMTANAFAQDVEKAFAAGMNGHVAKPIDVNELFQKMYRLMYT